MNVALAIAAVLILAVYGAGIWALTRIRNRTANYSRGFNNGYDQAVFDAYMNDLHADEERAAYEAITDEAIREATS